MNLIPAPEREGWVDPKPWVHNSNPQDRSDSDDLPGFQRSYRPRSREEYLQEVALPNEEERRPLPEARWVGTRETPLQFQLTTRWLYSDYQPDTLLPEGQLRWPFSRGGEVTASDVPSDYEHMQDTASHLHRAVSSFGDDRELLVEVRPQHETPQAFAQRLLASTTAQLAAHPQDRTLQELEALLQRLAKKAKRAKQA